MDVLNNAIVILDVSTDKEPLLVAIKDMVEQDFTDYCNRNDIPQEADGVILQMLIQQYNRLGAQGLSSQTYSSVSESYIDGYSANILKALDKYRKLKTI